MKTNNRRGISSIIGTMFVVILTVSALAATVSVVQQQQRATSEIAQEANRYLDALNEKIEISKTQINNNKLNLTLSNAGDSVAHVKSIYIVNETASPKEQYRYDVDYLVDGRADVTNVGQALPFVASDTASYTVRVVTESGNSASSVFQPQNLTPLPLSLTIIPPTVTTGENVTLLYTITNNLTSSELLLISPTISSSAQCDVTQVCTSTKLTSGPSTVVIDKGSFVIVKEIYKVEGPPNTIVTFNASFAEARAGNYVIDEAEVIVVSSTFGVNNVIATKPDIYLILPGPFGNTDNSDNDRALWGVVVVNPTNSTMKVSRVLITAFTASHTSDVAMYSPCSIDGIDLPDNEWDCPHRSQVQWKNLDQPITLAAGEVRSFLVRVEPGDMNIPVDPGVSVTATVYTDIGIFTKAGYTTAMRQEEAPLGSVYLTDTTTTTGTGHALGNNHIFGSRSNIAPNTSTTFYVALADFDTRTSRYIQSGAKLIINVPPGFSNVALASDNKFIQDPTITIRKDGITQIIGITSEHIGDSSGDISGSEVAVLAFTAITPSPSEDSIYIMTALVNGLSSANGDDPISVGALAEIPLQVNGTN